MENPIAAAIVLPEPWPHRVAGGMPAVALTELELPAGLEPGCALLLQDARQTAIGFGLHDPENGVLRLLPADSEEAFDLGFFRSRLTRALELRRRAGLVGPEAPYRLVNGEGDGLSGFLVDVYGPFAILYTFSPALEPCIRQLAEAVQEVLAPAGIVFKVRPPGEAPTGRIEPVLLHGSPPPKSLVVHEDPLRFEVHLAGGLNTGLFCEMREVRRSLSGWAAGRAVLNTFAYTGSLSVAAARGGARSVTTVDFASGVLQWAKTNFRLNGLTVDTSRSRFVRADVFEFLKAARRHGQRFDLVILDPPAATAVPGRRWFLETDYDRLVGHALGVIPAGGMLVAAASSGRSRPDRLENQIKTAARDHHRRLRLVQSFGLPPDFPTQMIYPQARYLKCFVLLVD